MSKFSKQHYEEIARVLNKWYCIHNGNPELGTIAFIREDFIDIFKKDNPKFDINKFRLAVIKNS